MSKIFGLTREYEPVMPEFDDLDAADIAFLTKAKQAHDPEPDPYREALMHVAQLSGLGL